jgi:hypothetical protein
MNKSLFPELETETEKPSDRKVVDLVARTVVSAPAPEDDIEAWWSHNTDSVVISEQLQVAVYLAARNDICIRQEARCCCDHDDACVFIRPEHLKALIARLTTFLQERGR